MKLIQLNLWLGHLMHPAIKFLKDENPDFVCCQEIVSSSKADPLFDTLQLHERLSELFPYQFFAPTSTFDVLGREATLGNAIYSRFPLYDQQTVFTNGNYAQNQTAENFVRNIRNIQTCGVTLPSGKTLHIANHHGFHDLDPAGTPKTSAAMRIVAETLVKLPKSLIFCGDLNVNPKATALRELDFLQLRNLTVENHLSNTLSSASRVSDPVVCDYIFTSDDIQVKRFDTSEQVISDHKALVVDFEI